MSVQEGTNALHIAQKHPRARVPHLKGCGMEYAAALPLVKEQQVLIIQYAMALLLVRSQYDLIVSLILVPTEIVLIKHFLAESKQECHVIPLQFVVEWNLSFKAGYQVFIIWS